MSLIADGLLIATCLTAGLYCFILSRRLKSFSRTDTGIGQQILQMNQSLEEMKAALKEAQTGARAASESLVREVAQSRKVTTQLANMIANAEKLSEKLRASNEADATEKEKEPPKPAKPRKSVAAEPIPIKSTVAAEALEDDLTEDEDLEDDINEEVLASEVAATPGAQQLGFVPDLDFDDDDDDDGDEYDDDLFVDDPDEIDAPGAQQSAPAADEIEASDYEDADVPPPSSDAGGQDDGLLKVERVAF